MVDATVVEKNGKVAVEFAGNTIVLPDSKGKQLKAKGYVGKEVIMGIRPENLSDEEDKVAKATADGSLIQATIRVYEMLGAEVYLYFDLGDANFTARVNPKTTARTGDTVKFAPNAELVHIFDKETELAVLD